MRLLDSGLAQAKYGVLAVKVAEHSFQEPMPNS